MDAAVASFVDARNNMVDGQLRPSKVSDRAVLGAMRALPREAFVPVAQLPLAYADVDVPVGQGRVLLAPLTVARLAQAAGAGAGAHVLVIGAGYAAALFACMGAAVTVVEPDARVRDWAAAAWRACAVEVTLVDGPMAAGWPAGAPYRAIFIDGAVPALPALAGQLLAPPAGRLCAVLALGARRGVAVVAEAAGDHLAQRRLFDCEASPLPPFAQPRAFRF
jgi:protein-L-isoaspartate(D-aspartate) O-methyltransferase